ncbi:hypothetical protein B0H11DRAFT_2029209 [Mycena galericulata]|nr:hypothetical protein B0H11DRAFT_2029209 [Mycena galericulata]
MSPSSRTSMAPTIPAERHSFFSNSTNFTIYGDESLVYHGAAASFYRLNNGTDHFYTASSTEMQKAIKGGYILEGIAALVFKNQLGPTAPFYRLSNTQSGDHFYTMSESERDMASASGGYTQEGVAAYIYATQICDSVPLYRLSNGHEHFYTADEDESHAAVTSAGYILEGVAGYVLKALVNGRLL